jgi:hypothetical protein
MINNYINQYNQNQSGAIIYFQQFLKKLLKDDSIFPDPLEFINIRNIGETITFKNIPVNSTDYNIYDIFNK